MCVLDVSPQCFELVNDFNSSLLLSDAAWASIHVGALPALTLPCNRMLGCNKLIILVIIMIAPELVFNIVSHYDAAENYSSAVAANVHHSFFSFLPTRFVLFCMHWQSRGDFIVVGDLMRSVSLLVYKAVDGAIEVGAAHCRHGRLRHRILPGLDEHVHAASICSRNASV